MDKLRREAREYLLQKPCNMRPEAELWMCTNLHCIWCLSFTVSSDWASHSEENQRGNLKRKKQHRYLLANLIPFLKRNTEKQDTITLQGTSDEKVASPAIHTSNSQEITCYRPYSYFGIICCSLATLSAHETEHNLNYLAKWLAISLTSL